jgi:putative toxin-antitoxin system antitoxin component (TIGR02293 family)
MSERTGVGKLLGGSVLLAREPIAWPELVEAVREGLPYAALESTAQHLHLSRDAASASLGIHARTFYRRKRHNARLSREESEKVLRLARIGAHALEVFEEPERATRWLTKPNRALGGATPLSLLDTDIGAEAVDGELGRIEHGVLA